MARPVKGFRSRKEERKLTRLQKEKRVQHLRRKSKTSMNEDDQERQQLLKKKTAMLKKNQNIKQEQRLAIKMEDKAIKEMERKLKPKRRKDGRLPNSFYAHGLGDILDFIDKRVDPGADLNEQPVDEETSEKNEGEDFDSEEDSLTEEEEDHDEDVAEGSLDLSDENDTEESKTDLYGNLVDKKGRVIPKTSQEQVVQELDKDLLRKIREQLNGDRIQSQKLNLEYDDFKRKESRKS